MCDTAWSAEILVIPQSLLYSGSWTFLHAFFVLRVQVITAATEAAKELGASHKALVSRAYHDSLFMSQIAPAGMIFIPCRNGWSHRPDEFASAADIETGVKALALTLAKLAGSAAAGERSEL